MSGPTPPRAEQRPVEHTIHGDTRIDEYAWLRAKDDPEVIKHLEAENAYTFAWLDQATGDLRDRLYSELLARIKQDDDTAPAWLGPWRYYSRTETSKPYRIHCRAPRDGGPETVLLDLNEMSDGGFIQISGYEISPSQRYLVYGVDRDGSEIYTLEILDTETMTVLPDRIGNAAGEAAWIDDDRFLYTILDPAHRPHKVLEHRRGDGGDREVFHEPDGRRWTHVWRTRDDRWLMISTDSSTTGETRFAPVGDPEAWRIVRPRRDDVEYDVHTQGDRLLIRTNDGATEFKLVEASVDASDRWQPLIEGRDDVTLEAVMAFDGFFVTLERVDGLKQVAVRFADGRVRPVAFPDPVYEVFLGPTAEHATRRVRLIYASMNRPQTSYDFDVDTGELHLIKQQEVPGGYDPDAYESERLFATAPDGTRVPISLVRRRGVATPGPLLLYGYGSYGIPIPAAFNPRRIPLLDRGVTFAIAHIRGGGDLGERWRNDGKFLKKVNTFTDFIACADHLIEQGLTTRERLAIGGGSAGGLLIGAVLNLRPDLCRAALAWVPFVDSLNTMLDASLPLTENEYEEWGNPNDPIFYDYMKGYAPYENVAEGVALPSILATAGLNDPRVHYWEPAKWVQRLRDRAGNDPLVLQYTNMGAGHAGAADRYEELREIALDWAFLLERLGVADVEPAS